MFKVCRSYVPFLGLLFTVMLIGFGSEESKGQAKQRVYASNDGTGTLGLCLSCGVANRGNAFDTTSDFLNTASTITVGVGIAGQQYQELIFPAGNLPTATGGSVVKVSTGGALTLSALGAITAQAYNGSTPVGSPVDAGSSLLNLLASGNQAEIFVPAPGATYDRIRVKVDGGLLGVAASINVYHAYFLKDAINGACDTSIEELHGIVGNVGALGGVTDPSHAIDNTEVTYSKLTAAVGLLGAYAQQTIVFLGGSVIGDSVRMVVSTPATLVELDLLNSIAIQTFNGNVPGAVVDGSSGLLKLRLISGSSNTAVITFAPTTQFDRVQLRLGGLASVLASINLHEVSRLMPTTTEINGVIGKSAVVCIGDPVVLKINSPQVGATYTWYSQASGGTGTAGTSFTPTNLTAGVNKFYVEANRTDCTNTSPRSEVTITVNDPIPPVVTAPSAICNGGAVTLQVASPVTGQTYTWYDVATGGTALTTGVIFNSPALTATKIYYVESSIGTCVSPRIPVNVTVNNIYPGVIGASQEICFGNLPIKLTSISSATASGSIDYQWQKSTINNDSSFSDITGEISEEYTESSILNQTTYYRRMATSTLNGLTCDAYSNILTVKVNPKIPTPIISLQTN